MYNDFLCSKCNGQLNAGEVLFFVGKAKDGRKGLLLLHPELGNYSVMNHKMLHIPKGDLVEFLCPICQENLTSELNNNLVLIFMIDEKQVQYTILFSKIKGERCTYKLTGDNLESFGEDSAKYIDIVKLSLVTT